MDTRDGGRLEYGARGADDQVHTIVVGTGAVPGAGENLALCGRTVFWVYDHRVETTCAVCSRTGTRAPTPFAHEPCG